MARTARITTISMAGGSGSTPAERARTAVDRAVEMIDRAAMDKPDLVVLPETFTALGCPSETWSETAETVPGPTSDRLAAEAEEHQCYIICPIVRRDGRCTFNSAVLLDRRGNVAGVYDKMHPTIGELEQGIVPGTEPVAFETDFGRIGMAICFDLNFRDVAEHLAADEVELVCFPSMYRGGLRTRLWAFEYGWFLASATPGEGSVILDPLGSVLEMSSAYEPIISHRINLDFVQLHIDENHRHWDGIKAKYGEAVELDVRSPEALSVLYAHDAAISARQIVDEFGLETTRDYFARSNRVRQAAIEEKAGTREH